MPSIKQRLKDGDVVIGSWINTASDIVAELMASCGFDFLCVDAEHSPIDIGEAHRLFQAIRSGNSECTPLVRVHGVDYPFVKRFLDAGARGIIAPLVRSKSDVELLTSATKYPPTGLRGVGFCRANQYGLRLQENVATANQEIISIIQIEHIDAVNRLDEIMTAGEVDAAFIGPYDLTASMGITAEFSHPDYKAATARILDACHQYGIAAGIHVVSPDPDEVHARIVDGYRLIAYSLDITLLTHSCLRGLESINRFRTNLGGNAMCSK